MLLGGRGVSGVCRAALATRSPAAQSQPALALAAQPQVGAVPATAIAGMPCPGEGDISMEGLADSWQQAAPSSHYHQACGVPIKQQVRHYLEGRMYQSSILAKISPKDTLNCAIPNAPSQETTCSRLWGPGRGAAPTGCAHSNQSLFRQSSPSRPSPADPS